MYRAANHFAEYFRGLRFRQLVASQLDGPAEEFLWICKRQSYKHADILHRDALHALPRAAVPCLCRFHSRYRRLQL